MGLGGFFGSVGKGIAKGVVGAGKGIGKGVAEAGKGIGNYVSAPFKSPGIGPSQDMMGGKMPFGTGGIWGKMKMNPMMQQLMQGQQMRQRGWEPTPTPIAGRGYGWFNPQTNESIPYGGEQDWLTKNPGGPNNGYSPINQNPWRRGLGFNERVGGIGPSNRFGTY